MNRKILNIIKPKTLPEKILFLIFSFGVLGILYYFYLEVHKVEFEKNRQLAALLSEQTILNLNERTKEENCETRGPLPDPDCTPGAIFKDATINEICVSGYSKTVRNVSTILKKKVFAQYGIDYPVPFGSYEIDHLIPLSLGGSNDIANLWPKSAEPWPGFYEKNITGNYLLEEVCAGRTSLHVAQERIAADWFLIYNNISEDKIIELKSKYKNWADAKK